MKERANWLGQPQFFNLNLACRPINDALGGFGCYLVGSSLKRRDYRDVDVRFIIEDERFERLFGKGDAFTNAWWALVCAAISEWLALRTSLPIDFQIQSQTEANTKFPRAEDHERCAIGIFTHDPLTERGA